MIEWCILLSERLVELALYKKSSFLYREKHELICEIDVFKLTCHTIKLYRMTFRYIIASRCFMSILSVI